MRCVRCNHEREDLKHIFWECRQVRLLWQNLVDWLNRTFKTEMALDPRTLLFGLLDNIDIDIPVVVWLCILIGKKYIWICRTSQIPLHFSHCLKQVQITEIMEASMATKNGTLHHHVNKWGPLASRVGDCIGGDIAITKIDTKFHYDCDPD